MSYSSHPHKGSNSNFSESCHQTNPFCAASSPPYPNPGGVQAPSIGFNVGSPIYIPQPYDGIRYPSCTNDASHNPSYPPSSHYPGNQNQPLPNNQKKRHTHSSYHKTLSSAYHSNPANLQSALYSSNQRQPYPQPSSYSRNQRNSKTFSTNIGFNVGSPMYMTQPYDRTSYSSSTSVVSFNPRCPQSSHYPGNQNQLYPNNQGERYSHSSFPSAPSSVSFRNPAYAPSLFNPSNQGQTYPQPSSYISNQRQTYPSSNKNNQPVYPNIQNHNSPHSSHRYGYHGGYSRTAASSTKSPTVVPASHFNSREDAEVLRKAMKGFGSDEKAIINVLTRRSHVQRLEIAVQFKTIYGKDLIKKLQSKLSGNFERIILALMTPLPKYYAKDLHDVISDVGIDESVLTEVLCALSNAEIRTIIEEYWRSYRKHLESDVNRYTSGHFRSLMVSLCAAARDETMVANPAAAAADAQELLHAGESTFIMILSQRNHEQLRLVFQEYQKIAGHDIEEAIKNVFLDDVKDGFLAVISSVKNQQAFFAQRLYKSMKGLGTNDTALIRLIVTRCEIDMGTIKRMYAVNHGESLAAAIEGDTSGDYRRCLLALIEDQR